MKTVMCLSVVGAVGMAVQMAVGDEPSALGRMCRTSDVYLEGNGTQSIDTGCTLGPNTRIVADISYDTEGRQAFTYHLWGFENDQGGQGRQREFVYLQNNDRNFLVYNTQWGVAAKDAPGSQIRQVVDYDLPGGLIAVYAGRANVWVCGALLTRGTETSTKTIGLFSYGHDGVWAGGMPVFRVYSFKVYESGTLVRDLVPYAYGAQTGLVDRVTGKIHTDVRHSSTPFKIGCDEASVRSKHDTWLDTGYHVCDKTKIAIDFAINTSVYQQRVFGCEGGEGAWCSLYRDDNGKLARGVGNGQLDGQAFEPSVHANLGRMSYVLDFPGNSETLVSGRKTLFSGSPACIPSQPSTAPLALFCKAVADGDGNVLPSQFSSAEIYSLKIWHDGVLVRDYVPRVTDNTAGLYDRQNETFLTATVTKDRQNQLEWAGSVETACRNGQPLASNGDTYLLSHYNEAINTGYYIQETSKILIDYSWHNPRGTEFLAGIGDFLMLYGQVYSAASPFLNCLFAGTWGGTGSSGDAQGTERRTRAEIDMPGKAVVYYNVDEKGGRPFLVQGMASMSCPSTLPLSVFAHTVKSGDQITCSGPSEVKLYSLKIYDGGELKHAYYPAHKANTFGLQDNVTGVFLAKTYGTKNFEMGGGGYDGLGQVFSLQPTGATLPVGGTKTLKAHAPGADGYQWFRNGEAIEGAVAEELEVRWRRGTPRTDAFKCVARYANWGYAESDAATVAYEPTGLVVIIR